MASVKRLFCKSLSAKKNLLRELSPVPESLRLGYLSQEADFELHGELWDVCLEPFADLIRMQGELEKLEVEMSDPIRREQALVRYGTLQHDFERRGGYVYQIQIKQVLTGPGFDPRFPYVA